MFNSNFFFTGTVGKGRVITVDLPSQSVVKVILHGFYTQPSIRLPHNAAIFSVVIFLKGFV